MGFLKPKQQGPTAAEISAQKAAGAQQTASAQEGIGSESFDIWKFFGRKSLTSTSNAGSGAYGSLGSK